MKKLCFALAGLHAGMLGALAMLAWLALSSAFYRRSVWSVSNLFASTFYGEPALRLGFGVTTLSGSALLLLMYSLLGAVFGLAIGGRGSRMQVLLLGVLSAIAWYYFTFGFFWKHVNPLIMLYSPDRPMLLGHILYGGLLGRFRIYVAAVSAAFGE